MEVVLKVGETLVTESRYHGYGTVTVERETKTTYVLSDGEKLRKPYYGSSKAIGVTGYGGTYYKKSTQELLSEVNRQRKLKQIRSVIWAEIDTPVIEQVLNLINPLTNGK